ncbi:uncharacterized protein LOC144124776 [Amblyomma americanum]
MRRLLLLIALCVASCAGDEVKDVRVEVGRALEAMGEWLQHEGAPGTEEERAALSEVLRQIEELRSSGVDLEQVDPYIWDKISGVATNIAKGVIVSFVTQQAMGLIVGAMG